MKPNKQQEAAAFRESREYYYQTPPKGLGAEVKRQDKISETRIKSRKSLSVRQHIRAAILSRMECLAGGLPGKSYSMGTLKKIHVLKFVEYNDVDCYEYPPSAKFRATHGLTEVRLTPAEFRAAKVIGGVLTIYRNAKAMKQPRKVEPVRWFECHGERQYAEIVCVSGYINTLGYHAYTKDDALHNLQYRTAEQKKVSSRKHIGINDALKAGLCMPGIKAFCENARLDITKKYRLSDILVMARQHGVYHYAIKIAG